ncbi:MAG: L,D-transpeptidase [Deltaproteobacteria bacterium]|nr:L,D-transpeptidase [Deltaproteobacteria bacterium]
MARRLRLVRDLLPLLLLGSLTLGQTPAEPAEADLLPRVETDGQVVVHTKPDWKSARRGVLLDCAVVGIRMKEEGPGCKAPWGQLRTDGWICLDFVAETQEKLPNAHPMVAFDHPTPEERPEYLSTGEFDRDIGPAAEALLPYVYGRRMGRFAGRCYADVEAAAKGSNPVGQLNPKRRQAFVQVIDTEDGSFLERPDGTVVPVDDVFLYSPSRFGGVDLDEDWGPEDTVPAWVRRGGGRQRTEATIVSEIIAELTPRTLVWVKEAILGDDGRTWMPIVRIGDGPGTGFIAASRVRRLRPLDPPDGVTDDEVWLDVDLDQQVLTVFQGTTPQYATMVSTGTSPDNETPVGLYRIKDKMLHWDMASRADADDYYHLEEVPWVMHYWPRYALHGAFWHDGFGERRSHGCINLAPKDARQIFDRTAPAVPPGWHSAWESLDDPGSLLRIRLSDPHVPDRRSVLR